MKNKQRIEKHEKKKQVKALEFLKSSEKQLNELEKSKEQERIDRKNV